MLRTLAILGSITISIIAQDIALWNVWNLSHRVSIQNLQAENDYQKSETELYHGASRVFADIGLACFAQLPQGSAHH